MDLIINKHVLTTGDLAETWVFDANSLRIYRFENSSALLWNAIQESKTLEGIVQRFCETYQIDSACCQSDIEVFLNQLISLGLVQGS